MHPTCSNKWCWEVRTHGVSNTVHQKSPGLSYISLWVFATNDIPLKRMNLNVCYHDMTRTNWSCHFCTLSSCGLYFATNVYRSQASTVRWHVRMGELVMLLNMHLQLFATINPSEPAWHKLSKSTSVWTCVNLRTTLWLKGPGASKWNFALWSYWSVFTTWHAPMGASGKMIAGS